MARTTVLTCPTCGHVVTSMDEHLKVIAERRANYGSSWDLAAPRRTYTVIDTDDVETEPLVPSPPRPSTADG